MPDGNDNLIEGEKHENVYPPNFEIGSIKPFHPSGNPEDVKDSSETQAKIVPFPKQPEKRPIA